jgi:hypothetical protein
MQYIPEPKRKNLIKNHYPGGLYLLFTWVGEGAKLRPLLLPPGSLRPPLPPLEAELSLDNMDTLSEKAESLSGLSVRTPETRVIKYNSNNIPLDF